MTTDERSPQAILARIAAISDELAPMEDHIAHTRELMAVMEEERKQLRNELLDLLAAQGITGVSGSGIHAAVRKRSTWRVLDAHAARLHFEETGELMNVVKLDEAKVIERAKNRPIPGVSQTISHELRIQEDK